MCVYMFVYITYITHCTPRVPFSSPGFTPNSLREEMTCKEFPTCSGLLGSAQQPWGCSLTGCSTHRRFSCLSVRCSAPQGCSRLPGPTSDWNVLDLDWGSGTDISLKLLGHLESSDQEQNFENVWLTVGSVCIRMLHVRAVYLHIFLQVPQRCCVRHPYKSVIVPRSWRTLWIVTIWKGPASKVFKTMSRLQKGPWQEWVWRMQYLWWQKGLSRGHSVPRLGTSQGHISVALTHLQKHGLSRGWRRKGRDSSRQARRTALCLLRRRSRVIAVLGTSVSSIIFLMRNRFWENIHCIKSQNSYTTEFCDPVTSHKSGDLSCSSDSQTWHRSASSGEGTELCHLYCIVLHSSTRQRTLLPTFTVLLQYEQHRMTSWWYNTCRIQEYIIWMYEE